MIYNKNVDIQHLSLQEFCGREECNRINYQYEPSNDIEAIHDEDEPIRFKIHGMEDGDKAEIEIEKSSDNEDGEDSKENEDETPKNDDNEEKEKYIMNAKNVPVYQDNSSNVDTYYVRLSDVREFMEINDLSITEALDSIIMANEDASVDADNMYVYYEESDNLSEDSISRLKENGIKCINKDSYDNMPVDEGCNRKNPIKEMKKNPETVNIAESDGTFYIAGADLVAYMEAADVDSPIDALDNIIEAYSSNIIGADNVYVVMDEASEYLRDELIEGFVPLEEKSSYSDASHIGQEKKWYRKFLAQSKKGLTDKADVKARINLLKQCVDKMEQARKERPAGDVIKYSLKDFIPFNSIVRFIKNKDNYAGIGALTDLLIPGAGAVVRAFTYDKMLEDQISNTKEAINYLEEKLKEMDK